VWPGTQQQQPAASSQLSATCDCLPPRRPAGPDWSGAWKTAQQVQQVWYVLPRTPPYSCAGRNHQHGAGSYSRDTVWTSGQAQPARPAGFREGWVVGGGPCRNTEGRRGRGTSRKHSLSQPGQVPPRGRKTWTKGEKGGKKKIKKNSRLPTAMLSRANCLFLAAHSLTHSHVHQRKGWPATHQAHQATPSPAKRARPAAQVKVGVRFRNFVSCLETLGSSVMDDTSRLPPQTMRLSAPRKVYRRPIFTVDTPSSTWDMPVLISKNHGISPHIPPSRPILRRSHVHIPQLPVPPTPRLCKESNNCLGCITLYSVSRTQGGNQTCFLQPDSRVAVPGAFKTSGMAPRLAVVSVRDRLPYSK
jgi:hypothetical protein